MSNLANIVIDDNDLVNGMIDLNTLRIIYVNLPRDAKIKLFSQFRGCCYILVESNSFIPTSQACLLPEITFTKDFNGLIDGLNFHGCLMSSTPSVPLLCAKCVTSPCSCVNAPQPTGISTHYNYTSPLIQPGDIMWDQGTTVVKRTGYTSLCTHEWKSYTGLNEMFDYCTKCNEKKT